MQQKFWLDFATRQQTVQENLCLCSHVIYKLVLNMIQCNQKLSAELTNLLATCHEPPIIFYNNTSKLFIFICNLIYTLHRKKTIIQSKGSLHTIISLFFIFFNISGIIYLTNMGLFVKNYFNMTTGLQSLFHLRWQESMLFIWELVESII